MSTPFAFRGLRLRAARPRPQTGPDELLLDALPALAPDDPLHAARAALDLDEDDDADEGEDEGTAEEQAADAWVEELLDEAEDALDREEPLAAIRACDHAEALFGPHAGARFVRAEARRALGELRGAAQGYRAAALLRPEHALSWASLAVASFELLDLPEAERAVARALHEDPREPLAWWALGVLRQWDADDDGAQRAFLHAAHLDPEACPLPPRLEEEAIDELINEVLLTLPEGVRAYMENVAIVIEEMPSEEALEVEGGRASPLEMLGLFSGHSLLERSHDEPWSRLPPTITLYRKNLERSAADAEELRQQVRVTLLHEIGHFLGLDEEGVAERGLE
jgi:predicted Zn-dependent protease with MMP-like domain